MPPHPASLADKTTARVCSMLLEDARRLLLSVSLAPMNVLVADDDGIIRLLLSSALTKLGHKVQAATNGREAWDAWHGGEFPFIISDWMMPDLDGLEFCRRIRAERRADYTYIVLLTSRSGKTNYLEAMTAGADDFITKPFEKDAFAARVRVAERILGLHASLRAANTDLERRVRERTAELEIALHAKDEFLSRASHELRTPMNHVLGFAQLLDTDALTDAQAGSVQQILTSGQHLLQLIDRILSVAEASSVDLRFLETPATRMSMQNEKLAERGGSGQGASFTLQLPCKQKQEFA
jgi:DNA-binding response OmpR family regulator